MFNPDWAVHPGETLRECLEERGLAQNEFGDRCGLSEQTVGQIILGKRLYSAETALAFERELGIPATSWMALKTNYQLQVARGGV